MSGSGAMTLERPSRYRHDALAYRGTDAFVALAADFLGEGADAGEPGILLTDARRGAAVRAQLGSRARAVSFVDRGGHGQNPALALARLSRFVADNGDRRVRALDEPWSAGLSSAAVAESELHQLLLNTSLCADWDMWLACAYDADGLGDDVLARVDATHPGDGRDLTNLVKQKFSAPLPARPADAQLISVDARDLAAIRTVVRTAATMAGMGQERVDGFVCAVNEVVTNSVRHGRGPAEVALWSEGSTLICEVHDSGRIDDMLAGRLPPPLGSTSGRGLWLAQNLCDLVQVRGPESGTAVRMHLDR